MLGIDTIMEFHRLAIDSTVKLLSKRKHKVDKEKRAIIDNEVQKQTNVSFMTKIKYSTWLANVVLVMKELNKWYMCVNFTVLNVACPKDPYPLPNIDRLMDGSSS